MAIMETFPLLQLPSTPLLHLLRLLPHSTLGNLAASCSFLHATLHSSPSLWRRLTLLPTMVATVAFTQSFFALLRRHGRHVTAVRMKMAKGKEVHWNIVQEGQVLGVLALSCPHLRHLAIPYINLGSSNSNYNGSSNYVGNLIKLIVNSLPHLISLEVRQLDAYSAASSAGGLEDLAELQDLTHLALSVLNTRKTEKKLAAVFSKLHNLRKVSLGVSGMFQGSPLIGSAAFLPNLVANNLQLEEVELDMQIKVTSKKKAMMKRRGVTLRQVWGPLGYESTDDEM